MHNVGAWLRAIAQHEALDLLRRRKVLHAIVGAAAGEGADVRVAIADGQPPVICRVTGATHILVDGEWGAIEDLCVGQRVVGLGAAPDGPPGETEELMHLAVQATSPQPSATSDKESTEGTSRPRA